MSKIAPDHTAGIRALPKAVSAWQQARLDAEAARGLYGNKRWDPGVGWVNKSGEPVARPKPAPSPFGKEGTVSKQIDELLKTLQPKIEKSHQRHNNFLEADTSGSKCFAELYYSAEDGGVYGTFLRDGYNEFWQMSRSEAREWFEDDSLGGYYNAVVAD